LEASDSDKRVLLLRLLSERGPMSSEEAAEALAISKTTVVQATSPDPRQRRYRIAD